MPASSLVVLCLGADHDNSDYNSRRVIDNGFHKDKDQNKTTAIANLTTECRV